MNIPSLLRSFRKKFFGSTPARRKPFRRDKLLEVEPLECRIVPAVTPTIVSVQSSGVTITNLSTWSSNGSKPTPSPNPIQVTFSESMFAPTFGQMGYADSAANPANYELFNDSTGAAVAINSVSYTDTASGSTPAFTATIGYNSNNPLQDGTYTLFVKGAQLFESSDTLSLSQPGQLVVANTSTNGTNQSTVSTINYNGNGVIGAAETYPLSQDTSYSPAETPVPDVVTIADLNGDGLEDIAIANAITGSVEVFLRQSTGGFNVTPDATLYLANDPLAATTVITGIVAANLGQPFGAGSGLPDLAVTDSSGFVNVFVNDTKSGSSTLKFANGGIGVKYAAGTSPVGLVAGAWQGGGFGGGRVGLAVADNGASSNDYDVTILPGNGDGTLGGAVTIVVGATTPSGLVKPTGLAVGNLNGDNLPDLAVVGSNGMLPLLNTSTGGGISFSGGGATSTPIGVAGGSAVAFNSVAIGVLASGSTASQADIAATSVPAAGSDAQLFVFANAAATGGTAGVFTNAASTPFTITGAGAVQSLVLQYPNGFNGLEEALVASPSTNSFFALVDQSTGSGLAFASPVSYQTDYGPVALASGDVFDDANPDVVTVNVTLAAGAVATGPSFSIVAGNGDGTFADATTVVETATPPPNPPPSPDPTAVVVGDLNGDGIPDLVVLDSGANQVEVYLATAPGVYAAPVAYSVLDSSGNGGSPVSVALADLTGTFYSNGEPVLDIVTADQTPNNDTGAYYISVLANNADNNNTDTSGAFNTATTVPVGELPTDIAAGLFDASNGKTAEDLIVSHDGASSQGVTFLHNITTSGGAIDFTTSEVEITTTNLDFDPSAVVVGDFNNDGNLDFVLLSNDTADDVYNVYLVEGDGQGDFPQVLGPYDLSPYLTPSAIAVGDFNRDGFLDIVVVGTPTNGTTASIETLLNNHGFGFQDSAVLTNASLPGSAVPYSVAVTDVNSDTYPDLVVSTVFTGLTSTNPATVEDLFTLTGVGDGTFDNPIPYEAGGEPTPTPSPTPVPEPVTVAIVSDPLVPVVSFFQAGPLLTVNLIENGNFSATDLNGEAGNLDGWQTTSYKNSEGEWTVQQKAANGGGKGGGNPVLSPLSNTPIVNPPNNAKYQALLDEDNLIPYPSGQNNPNLTSGPGGSYNGSYNGSDFLYQRIFIPTTFGTASTDQATLSLSLYVNNTTGKWYSGPSGNPLNFNVSTPNEQVLIDFIADPTSPQDVTTAASLTNGVIYQTSSTEAAVFSRNLSVDVTNFLEKYAGKYIVLRIAAVNNQAGPLLVGVDNVSLKMTFLDTTNPTLTGLQLRNPGEILAPSFIPTTTDPTIIGQVGDAGGVNAIAALPGFVQFYTTNTTLASGFEFTYTTEFDAEGNFAVTIPNLAYGLDTVTITVESQSGNLIQESLTFDYQGPSVSGWQAVGPGGISTAGVKGITYSTVSGRVTATAVDPTDPSGNTIFVGSENGGVWKTTDGGANWTPLTDFVTNQSGQPINVPVGAIAVSNDGTVFVGTGDGNVLPDALGGNGILVSTDGGFIWTIDGNSGTVLAGARITAMATTTIPDPVDPNTTDLVVFVAVASGGEFGPGVYRTLNALAPNNSATWTNILTPANMGLPATTTLASVTSLVLDPSNNDQITIGLGNIGLVPASTTAGIWVTAFPLDPSNAHWNPIVGGDNPAIPNDTVPSGVNVGRVTLAEGFGVGQNEPVFYALIGNPTSATPVQGGSESFGSGTGSLAGLYKTSDVGKDWTKVQLLQQTGVNGPDSGGNYGPIFSPINLLGQDAGNAGSLVVDSTDPNIVYVGGSTGFDPAGGSLDHGLIEVDTGDMFDATNYATSPAAEKNSGDSMTKYFAAESAPFLGYYDPTINSYAYKAEGVSWYDLSTGTYEGLGVKSVALPAEVLAMTLDSQDRLIVGTEEGLWRIDSHGIPYDFTSGGGLGFRVGGIMSLGKGGLNTPTANVHITTLNGNLQIADLTSVAIDPLNTGTFYAAGYGTGTERTSSSGLLSWQTMGLTGAQGQVDAGTVLTAAPAPNAPPGTPTTLYVDYAYTNPAAGFDPEISTQGGALGSFSPAKNKGISIRDTAGFFPVLVIDPNKIPGTTSGTFEDELLFGTNNVYTTRTSSNAWLQINQGTSLKAGYVVTAAAIAPSNSLVLYAAVYNQSKGTSAVFVTQNNGADGFPEEDSGLPTGTAGAVATGFAVDPTNPLIAFVTFGGLGNYSHVYMTANGGKSWTSIQGNLPNVPAYSFVTDPRQQAAAGAPNGHLYIGTEVGAFVSVNGGTTWTPLGQGLPNVPVVALNFNQSQEELVAATQGRGVFVISTDRDGATVTTVTPSTPALPPMKSVTVTFNKSIASFPVSQVTSITGPNGMLLATTTLAAAITATQTTIPIASSSGMPTSGSFRIQIGSETLLVTKISVTLSGTKLTVQRGYGTPAAADAKGAEVQFGSFLGLVQVTDVTPVIQGQSDKHDEFQISFPKQQSDGVYTFSIGPVILDKVGNEMDQKQNGTISGDTFQVVLNSTDDGQFVTGLYHDLLGISPTTAQFITTLAVIDPTRFAALPGIAGPLIQGTNARTELIDELYASNATPLSSIGIGNLLPNDPTLATDEANSLKSLKNGASVESIIDSIVSTLTFYTNAGNTDTAWVTAVIGDLIGPSAKSTDVATYLTQLTNAEKTKTAQAARLQVAAAITSSTEYKQDLINAVFEDYTGLAPTASQLSTYLAVVGKGAAAAGALTGDEQLLKGVFGSQQYFMNQTDASGLHTNQSWADSLYTNLQISGFYPGAALTTAETATDTAVLNAYATQRQTAAKSLLTSTAYRTIVIDNLYKTYTGQLPTTQQLNAWLTNFAAGQTQENLIAALLQTDAFRLYAPTILGVSQIPTPTTTVEAAFTLLFPGFVYTTNTSSSQFDITHWTPLVSSTTGDITATLAKDLLALSIYYGNSTTQPTYSGLIARLFKQYTGVAAAASDISTWTTNFKNGKHDEDLIAYLLATTTYFNKTHTFP